MNLKILIRFILLVSIFLFLVIVAWWAIEGGLGQWSRSDTFGQQLETILQIVSGILGLLVVITCFWMRNWSRSIRLAWAVSLVTVAGLSAIVWGPPMPLISLLFAGVALTLAWIVIWSLEKWHPYPGPLHSDDA